MDDPDSFTDFVGNVTDLSQSRDPRSRRVGATLSALVDVIEGDVTSVKVYASTISTLEGTLHQTHTDVSLILDSLSTQSALLKILCSIVPHVAPPALGATVDLTSRVLRGVVSSCLSIFINETNGTLLDTKDGLGGMSAMLSNACDAVTEILRYLPRITDERAMRQLLNSTLLTLIQDTRAKVQNAAKEGLSILLSMRSPRCHPAIVKGTMKYMNAQIDVYQQNPSQQSENQAFIEFLGLLGTSIVSVDFTSIAGRLMTIMVDLFNEEAGSSDSRPVFVAGRSHKATLKVLTINSILSTILSLLENDENLGEMTVARLNALAVRVLASLVQARPTLTFREGAAEDELLETGRSVYGQVILSAAQRVVTDENQVEVGAKLLPLALVQIISLSRPLHDGSDNGVAETLSAQTSHLFRTQIPSIQVKSPAVYDSCLRDCLRIMMTVIKSPTYESQLSFLKSLPTLLQQMDGKDELVRDSVLSMVQLRCGPSGETPVIRTAVDGTLISLIEGIGIEQFWNMVNLSELCIAGQNATSATNTYVWLIDILKTSGSISSANNSLNLSFFQDHILPLARNFDGLSVKRTAQAAFFRAQVTKLWGLFPVFCRRPADLVQSLPNLAPTLVKAMTDQRYPELIAIVCNGMDVLATGAWDRLKSNEELIDNDDALPARLEVETLGKLSTKLLPALFKLVDSLHDTSSPKAEDEMIIENVGSAAEKDAARVTAVTQAIASIARLTPKSQIQGLFTKIVQRMLQTSQVSGDGMMLEKMCALLALSQALVASECLDDSSVSLLYRSVRPLIRTDETPPRIQKRAYKVLAEICKRYHSFVADPERLQEVLELLSSTSATSQVSARSMRLKCLNFVAEGFGNSLIQDRQKISETLVGETLLCLKDSNAKTREAAYKLLLTTARVYGDSPGYIRVVAAAIGAKSPHMRSAAVTALSRLVFELSSEDHEVQDMLPLLLKTVLLLSDDPSREVTKSMVIFVRISVAVATPEQLQPLLPEILNGLLKYHRGKDRFRAKIKIVIKKLVKSFGFDVLTPYVPLSDSRLLTHMRKLSEREHRRKDARLTQRRETTEYDAMVDYDEEDSDDGNTLVTGMSRKSKLSRVTGRTGGQSLKRSLADPESLARSTKSGKAAVVTLRVRNDQDGHVLDVKELTSKSVRFAEATSDDSESDGDLEFDASGKLVVPDVDDKLSVQNNNDADTMMSYKTKQSTASSTIRGDSSTSRNNAKKASSARPGSVYKAKGAGGDVKRKGQKYEPYAYVQLDGRNYSKKNRRQAVEKMGSVVQRGNKRQKR